MPAAAVIPAPIAYIKVAAVKKLVVGSQSRAGGPAIGGQPSRPGLEKIGVRPRAPRRARGGRDPEAFTLKKLGCSKQACSLNSRAWNNLRGPVCPRACWSLAWQGND